MLLFDQMLFNVAIYVVVKFIGMNKLKLQAHSRYCTAAMQYLDAAQVLAAVKYRCQDVVDL